MMHLHHFLRPRRTVKILVTSLQSAICCLYSSHGLYLRNKVYDPHYSFADAEFHSTESPRNSHDMSEDVGSSVQHTESSDESSITENSETRRVDVLDNIKKAVVEMATNVSSFVQNLFGFSSAENVSDSATDGKAKTNFMDNKSLGASFMALAVMVIMVVVMKRA